MQQAPVTLALPERTTPTYRGLTERAPSVDEYRMTGEYRLLDARPAPDHVRE
jgi:hypothetical protein